MVFFSIPDYLHPNSNWQQQLQYQQQLVQQNQSTYGSSSSINSNPWSLLLPPPPSSVGLMVGPSPIARPGSMVELARISNISRPPGAVKCPRCGSMNTKFCYYNNRSLSQPRHWCRDCRRHWTQGGVLRPIPIGGVRRGNRRPRASSFSGPTANSAATPAAPPLGLDNYYDGTNYSLNGFEINGGSVGAEQWRIAAAPVLPSIEIEHVVVGLNGLEEIGHDKFDNLF